MNKVIANIKLNQDILNSDLIGSIWKHTYEYETYILTYKEGFFLVNLSTGKIRKINSEYLNEVYSKVDKVEIDTNYRKLIEEDKDERNN